LPYSARKKFSWFQEAIRFSFTQKKRTYLLFQSFPKEERQANIKAGDTEVNLLELIDGNERKNREFQDSERSPFNGPLML